MNNLVHLFRAVLLLLGAAHAAAGTLTDQVMAELLWRHLPNPLYGQDQNPWPGGSYDVRVFKHGRPEVVSGARTIHINLPLRVEMRGQAASSLLGLRMDCHSSFVTQGSLLLEPVGDSEVSRLQSSIELPVPPVMADCKTLQLPIESYVEAFVARNKPQWERQLDAEISAWLNGRDP